MVYVIATVECKEGSRDAYLEVLRSNIPAVLAENGCLKYEATIDADSGIPLQGAPRQNAVTIMEAWEDLGALHQHLKTPHMAAYRERAKEFVTKLAIQVLRPV
jgi:quinol monooxygenase YgiN